MNLTTAKEFVRQPVLNIRAVGGPVSNPSGWKQDTAEPKIRDNVLNFLRALKAKAC